MEQHQSDKKQKSCAMPLSCAGLFVIIIVLPFVVLFTLWAAGRFLVVSDPLEHVSAVVALSGAEDSSRLEEAAKIYQEGLADWIILTETGEVYPETTALLTSIYRQDLVRMGVPENVILVTEKIASSTWGEARVVRKLMLREGFDSCIVVTDPYHTRRTQIVFDDEFNPHDLKLIVHPTSGSWFRSSTWWMQKSGWEVLISEYGKMVGYFFGLRQD